MFKFSNGLYGWLDFTIFGIISGHGGKLTSAFVKDNIGKEINIQIEGLYSSTQDINSDPSPETLQQLFTDNEAGKLFTNVIQKLDTRIALEIPSGRDGCSLCLVAIPKIKLASQEGAGEAEALQEVCSTVFYCVNLGDCCAFLCRQGQIAEVRNTLVARNLMGTSGTDANEQLHAIPLCEQHKPFVLTEKQRIIASGGTIENAKVNGVLKVTRSLGDLPLKKFGVLCIPTLKKFRLADLQDICIVLSSDSFFVPWTPLEGLKRIHFSLKAVRYP